MLRLGYTIRFAYIGVSYIHIRVLKMMTSAKNKCFAKISLIYQAITENAATLVLVST